MGAILRLVPPSCSSEDYPQFKHTQNVFSESTTEAFPVPQSLPCVPFSPGGRKLHWKRVDWESKGSSQNTVCTWVGDCVTRSDERPFYCEEGPEKSWTLT